MEYLIGYLIGMAVAFGIFGLMMAHNTFGEFQIDVRDPDKDIMRMVWSKDPGKIKKHKWIVLQIKTGYELDSQKLQRF